MARTPGPLLATTCCALVLGCAGQKPLPQTAAEPAAPPPAAKPSSPSTPGPTEPVAPVVAKLDSTGADPRVEVLVEDMDFSGVRTRLVPHVMGRGWMLSVNKGDSIEFLRPADPGLAQMLFGLVPEPGTRIRLRFRLATVPGGVKISSMGHLIGRNGPLPYRASKELLAQSLEELKHDLLTAPVSTEPQVDRLKTKSKAKH